MIFWSCGLYFSITLRFISVVFLWDVMAVHCPIILKSIYLPVFTVRSRTVARRRKQNFFDHFDDDILIEFGLIMSNVFLLSLLYRVSHVGPNNSVSA